MYSSIFVTELIDWDILAFVGWGSPASVNRAGTGEKILLKVPFYGQFLNMEPLFYEATSTIRKTSFQYQSSLSTFWYRIKLLLPVSK